MSKFMSSVALATALVSGAALVSSSANAITVNNSSFETLPAAGLVVPCGTGCAYSQNDPIPGWSSTSTFYGQWQPGPYPGGFNYLPDGPTIAYSVVPGTISQLVGTAVTGAIYTLQVDVGHRLDNQFTAPTVELQIGATTFDVNGPTPTLGNWATWTVSGSGNSGDAITINLIGNGQQADFDNVRLAATPLPSTWLMLLSGFVGLGFFAYRGTKRNAGSLVG